MRKHGLDLLPYFPLASGLLTGKYKHGAPLPPGSRLANSAPRGGGVLNDAQLADRRGAVRLRGGARAIRFLSWP